MNTAVADYWIEHYLRDGHCSLCGNRGWLDSRGVSTPAGMPVGRLNFCVCPNGQAWREGGADLQRLAVTDYTHPNQQWAGTMRRKR